VVQPAGGLEPVTAVAATLLGAEVEQGKVATLQIVTVTGVDPDAPVPLKVYLLLPPFLTLVIENAGLTVKDPEEPSSPTGEVTEITPSEVDWASRMVMDAVAWPDALKVKLLLPAPQVPAPGYVGEYNGP
jgi:hypothetical protein